MKRLDEMNEKELIELRATMTPEEIKEVMEREQKELEEHMVKMGFDAQVKEVVETIEAGFDEEDEGGEKVTFNPQTGEVTSVESTLLVREKENKIQGGNTTLIEMPEEDFSFIDIIVLCKAIGKVLKKQREQHEKMHDLALGEHNFSGKINKEMSEMIDAMRLEIRTLSNLIRVCEANLSIVKRERLHGEPVVKVNIKKEIEKLDTNIQYQIQYYAKSMVDELLDIL